MSLILEALRKSEAERRRGETPDLHAELAPVPAPAPRLRLPAVLTVTGVAALLAVSLVLALAWRPAADTGRPGAEATPPASLPAGPEPRSAGRRGAGGDAPVHLPPVDRLQSPPVDTPTPTATDARAGTGAEQRPVSAVTHDAASGDSATPGAAPSPAADAASRPAGPDPVGTVTAPASPASLGAAADPAEPAAGGVPALPNVSELRPDERRQLPAMKLTLHMWNADPARRFVILDGVRHAEGDRIGSGRIRAIDSDGVVIDLGDRAVRLPLR